MKHRFGSARVALLFALWFAVCLPGWPSRAGAQVEVAGEQAKQKIQAAGETVATTLDRLWHQIDEQRLKNRTRDEITGWLIVGILIGSLAWMFGLFKQTVGGRVMSLVAGLVGAFLGGIIVHLGRIDFGLGPVLVRYEELLFAFVGAVAILFVTRLVLRRWAHRS